MRHYNCRIAIRLEALERDKIDRLIFERKFKNRSQAIRAALAELLSKSE
ncbi:MAG: ribbon-helix-helix protein, CopG family [Crenarchaeota archaeon]|nr:ribbon-helix-helix protein, CopG family [Thermoproteota archaeon]